MCPLAYFPCDKMHDLSVIAGALSAIGQMIEIREKKTSNFD